MATISDRYSIHTDSNVSKNIYNNEQKKNDEDEEIKRSQLSSMDGYQGEKTTKKVNDSVQIGKTDTLSSFQSINENKKSDRMSPTSKKSSDNNTKKKNNEKTIKKSQQKEESRSTTMSSTSIGTNNIKREEVVSSSLNNNENNRKDESTTLNNMKKRKSTSNNSDSKTKESTKLSPTNVDSKNDNAFPIQKDDAQHLTDFQLEKAKYFFNVNLDIENKEYVTWEDVEFYLLFHATAAGKEGSDGDDLEVRLNRAAKAFWEHVHDQVPLSDGKRDTLTLDQFLDTWAGLIDYVVRTNQLPPIIQDLVKLGFELYSTDNGNDKPTTIQPAAFDQLFQKMNIGRPYAIMAYKYLTENGTKPLDADKIDSLVKAVITSSDDEHDSHFLLPGFFKTIANTRNNEKDNKPQTDSSGPDEDISQTSEKSSSTSRAPSQTSTSRSQTPILHSKSRTINESLASSISQAVEQNLHSASLSKEQQKPREQQPPPAATSSPRFTQQNNSPSSPSPRFQQQPQQQQQQQQQQKPSPLSIPNEQKRDNSSPYQHINTSISSNNIAQSPTPSLSTSQRQNISSTSPRRQKIDIQREDENIRNLLRYYHIDDGDVVEVADGNNQRIVLIHPDRPVPSYIQDERQSLQKIKQDATMSQNGSINAPNKSNNNEKSSQEPNITESKPNITLEGRVFRGEAQKGPTIPLQQDHSQERSSSQNVRQVYPKINEEQNEDLRKKACKRHEKHSNKNKKKNADDTSITSDIQSSRKDEKKPKKDTSHNEEEKIVAAILKHLAPIVEQRVHEEIRRIDNDETDQDEDDNFLPFPFMLAAGLPFFSGGPNGAPPSQEPRQQQQQTSQQNAPSKEQQQNQNVPRGPDFGGTAFMPPPLFMAMMSDLARGGAGGDMPGFPHNMSSSSRGPGGAPVGVEGFMMFVDDNQMMGGTSGFPPRPGPRF